MVEEDYQSDIRHDLRNKIQLISGYLELLSDEDISDDARAFLEKSINATEESVELLEDWKRIQGERENSE